MQAVLLQNQTSVQTSAPMMAKLLRPDGTAFINQVFYVELDGIGSCSATVQLVGKTQGSDQQIPYGQPINVSATNADITPGVAAWGGALPYREFGAYVTAISGTNASVTVRMSA